MYGVPFALLATTGGRLSDRHGAYRMSMISLVLVAPLAVSLGLAGALLAVTCCLVVMLRTRQYRTSAEVLVGLASGLGGLIVVGASILVVHESWRPTAAVILAVAGALLLAGTLAPSAPSV